MNSKYISEDVINTLFQFIPSSFKQNIITSSHIYPNIELLSGIFDLDDIQICNSFSEDNFKILIKNTYLDRQKLFNCVVNRGLIEYVKILLKDNRKEKIIDPSANNNYAIRRASGNGHLEVVKLLLNDKRVNPSDVNNETFKLSFKLGYIDIVRVLLTHSNIKYPKIPDLNVLKIILKTLK